MNKQKPVEKLREKIRLLEIRQAEEGKILKEQVAQAVQSLRPINLIKNAVKDMTSSVELRTNLVETLVSILGGYLTKKLMINPKSGPFLKVFGAILQFGVTNVLAQNAEKIREFVINLINSYFPGVKEEAASAEPKS